MNDPKYQHGSIEDGWMEQNDTPRTDAAKSYWDSAERENCVSIVLARELERELKDAQEAYLKSVERDDYLTQGLAASKAEVERLKKELADWDYGTRAKREQERAERAEAEVERLRDALDTLTAVVGLTPIAGNKEALQEAFDLARKALNHTNK
jgi:hypothetical protein